MINFGIEQLKISDITYIENELFKNKDFIIKSYEYFKNISDNDLKVFTHKHAFYNIPTLEQITWLKNYIKNKNTIEIGSGNGFLAKALNINATDNFQQESNAMNALYNLFNQPTVKYGRNVQKVSGNSAVELYNPDIVLACWVTQKYIEGKTINGNVNGIIEEEIINKATYVFIGNETVHANKYILKYPHQTFKFPWLLSRKGFDNKNVIWIWEKK